MMSYNLKGGVLIIGSLFWQDDLEIEGDSIRKDWRHNRLNLMEFQSVSIPIKYGRFSGKKAKGNQTYTMVFDKNLAYKDWGKAKFIPFQAQPRNWDDLKYEIFELSYAEGCNQKDFMMGNLPWGVCCILFNDRVDSNSKTDILEKWDEELKRNNSTYTSFFNNPALYSLSNNAELLIDWPKELKHFDYVIATSTLPAPRDKNTPITPGEIVKHIPNRDYFIPNYLRGIGTYQDEEIIQEIRTKKEITQDFFKWSIKIYHEKQVKDPNHRYWSWNHSFDAFKSKKSNEEKALHLGAYLASWGMYRGSGGLLQKDYKIHIHAIEILSKLEYQTLYEDPILNWEAEKVLIQNLFKELSKYYSGIYFERGGTMHTISDTPTLVSKILLGTFACIPAYDQFFVLGLKTFGLRPSNFGNNSLSELVKWIQSNDLLEIIEKEFQSALPTMKYLDIFFWSIGFNLSQIKKTKNGSVQTE